MKILSRRGSVLITAMTLGILALPSQADTGAIESLSALIRDLPGWSAAPATVDHLVMPQTVNGPAQDLVTVARHYAQGTRTLDIRFLGGASAASPSIPKEQNAKTADGFFRIAETNGFVTMLTARTPAQQADGQSTAAQQNAGQADLVIWLIPNAKNAATLAITGSNMTGAEILDIATTLDWKALSISAKAI